MDITSDLVEVVAEMTAARDALKAGDLEACNERMRRAQFLLLHVSTQAKDERADTNK